MDVFLDEGSIPSISIAEKCPPLIFKETGIFQCLGYLAGKNSQEMARKLCRRFGVSMYNASRLARTEMARVQTEAQMQSFERNGYTHYVFIARESACDHCAPLDGKIFAVKDIRPGVNAPPIHPDCFCSIAAATTKHVQAKELAKKHIERMKEETL